MLDNEPTTEAATAATARSTAKKTVKKTAAKKTTATTARKRVAKTAAAEVPTQSDAVAADPAPKTAKKAVAKKAVAKKAVAKKAAATPVKRAAKKVAEPEPAAAEAPAKKAPARKRATTKKAAATLVATDTPLTDGPVADAGTPDAAPARRTRSRRGAAQAAEPAAQTPEPAAAAPARTTFTGTSHVRSSASLSAEAAAAADSAGSASAADSAAESGPSASKRTSRRRGAQPAADAPAASEATPLFPTAGESAAAAEAPAEETTTGARRTRRRAPAAAAVLFQAPTVPSNAPAGTPAPAQAEATSPVEATDPAPTTRSRSRRGAKNTQSAEVEAEVTTQAAEPGDDEQPSTSRRRRSRRGRDAEAREEVVVEELEDDEEEDENADAEADETADEQADDVQAEDGDDDESAEGTRRRRRRRGGRRRRKTGDAEDSADEQDENGDEPDDAEASADDEQDGSADDGEDAGSSSRRRRRRRRRKGEEGTSAADDPDEIVVRVREPRSKNTANEVTAIEGSTRLEAKKQRRREGRAAGRRRAPIVSEAEFLARRESVERTMVIRSRGDLTQIAVSEDNVLVEHYVTTADQSSLIGNVYLGRVQNVLPSMEAAFIDIGKGRNAVLYAGEVDWASLGGSNGSRKIEQVLKSGQSVLVQVTKDPIGHKGARLTNQISLPGRYVVYVPRGGNGGISRKLPDTERNRLKTILKDIVPDEAGVIVRTAAEGATEQELTLDVTRLQAFWTEIDKKSKGGNAPALLHGEPDLLIRVVRDLFTEDFSKLVISGDEANDQVSEYVASVAPHLADRVEKWGGDGDAKSGDVFASYRIDEQIKKALDRKVWLPSGGSLVIDRTEAMTVVDVNTGKFTGSGGNLEETVTKNNLEAAEEIVRQLRLRDIGGIIVIDFIDMVLESNRDLVMRRLVECLGRDRTKHQVAEVTSLGLVQMTRKRIGTGLLEAFSENCDHCGGRGLILHDEPKESRRRDGGRGTTGGNAAASTSGNTGGNTASANGNGSTNGNGNNGQSSNGHDKPAAQAEESGRKSSRRRRGKGRSDEESTEAETAQHHADAAQHLAQIAAASAKKDAEGAPEPTGYPMSGHTDEPVSPEATGFPPADVPADGAEAAEAEQNGTKSTRRRRSSRGRGKTAGDAPETPSELVSAGQ
ncbi:Rne/Rng family ribonuclease [Kribbella antibiotica]|uniref:Ribonuclease E n=1 Tax=Kribbella antibiotica TaxID=190195 RepID=A0A4R4ZTP0_9ACTN|nr:Rne/Rng family ribonuclease [Kribbella antibiotica]TDD62205.1 Rne/Rng family ribonuclease [Kribbella antibiotica]